MTLRTVVGREHHHGAVAQAEFVDLGGNASDHVVDVAHVGRQGGLRLVASASSSVIDFRAGEVAVLVALEIPRFVRKTHGEVDKERPVLVARHEIANEIDEQFRAVVVRPGFHQLAVVNDRWMPVARRSARYTPPAFSTGPSNCGNRALHRLWPPSHM